MTQTGGDPRDGLFENARGVRDMLSARRVSALVSVWREVVHSVVRRLILRRSSG